MTLVGMPMLCTAAPRAGPLLDSSTEGSKMWVTISETDAQVRVLVVA
jgi:hypothetical protein